jgi:hypothetical protein
MHEYHVGNDRRDEMAKTKAVKKDAVEISVEKTDEGYVIVLTPYRASIR